MKLQTFNLCFFSYKCLQVNQWLSQLYLPIHQWLNSYDKMIDIVLWLENNIYFWIRATETKNPWLTFHEILVGSKGWLILVLAYHNPYIRLYKWMVKSPMFSITRVLVTAQNCTAKSDVFIQYILSSYWCAPLAGNNGKLWLMHIHPDGDGYCDGEHCYLTMAQDFGRSW